jgi:hypothetical protein
MSSAYSFPAVLIFLSLFSWTVFPRRIAQEVSEWELTPQEGTRYIFMYRGWSLFFGVIGVALVILTFAGK